jgi:hypothetical protein
MYFYVGILARHLSSLATGRHGQPRQRSGRDTRGQTHPKSSCMLAQDSPCHFQPWSSLYTGKHLGRPGFHDPVLNCSTFLPDVPYRVVIAAGVL